MCCLLTIGFCMVSLLVKVWAYRYKYSVVIMVGGKTDKHITHMEGKTSTLVKMNVLTVSALPSVLFNYKLNNLNAVMLHFIVQVLGEAGGKLCKMCNILGLLHWKWLVLDKDMKQIPTGLLWSETYKEKNAANILVCKKAYLSTAVTLLKAQYFIPVTFQLRKSWKRIQTAAGKKNNVWEPHSLF